MIGRDAGEAEEWEWRNLADFFAEAQLRAIQDAALQVLSAARLPADAPVVAAGTGRFVVEKLAARLGRRCESWASLVRKLMRNSRLQLATARRPWRWRCCSPLAQGSPP